eukprot:gene12635-12764_t
MQEYLARMNKQLEEMAAQHLQSTAPRRESLARATALYLERKGTPSNTAPHVALPPAGAAGSISGSTSSSSARRHSTVAADAAAAAVADLATAFDAVAGVVKGQATSDGSAAVSGVWDAQAAAAGGPGGGSASDSYSRLYKAACAASRSLSSAPAGLYSSNQVRLAPGAGGPSARDFARQLSSQGSTHQVVHGTDIGESDSTKYKQIWRKELQPDRPVLLSPEVVAMPRAHLLVVDSCVEGQVIVIVMSLGFIFFVTVLHIIGKKQQQQEEIQAAAPQLHQRQRTCRRLQQVQTL